MPTAYFETDSLTKLSNKELIEKQKEIVNKYSLSQTHKTSKEIVLQLYDLVDIYTAELDRRIVEGLIDEDELEDEYEDFV
jgi:hypothetical protein